MQFFGTVFEILYEHQNNLTVVNVGWEAELHIGVSSLRENVTRLPHGERVDSGGYKPCAESVVKRARIRPYPFAFL